MRGASNNPSGGGVGPARPDYPPGEDTDPTRDQGARSSDFDEDATITINHGDLPISDPLDEATMTYDPGTADTADPDLEDITAPRPRADEEPA